MYLIKEFHKEISGAAWSDLLKFINRVMELHESMRIMNENIENSVCYMEIHNSNMGKYDLIMTIHHVIRIIQNHYWVMKIQ